MTRADIMRINDAVEIIRLHPGCTKSLAAARIGPPAMRGHPVDIAWRAGYGPLNAAIRAGLIVATRVGSAYSLTIPAGTP